VIRVEVYSTREVPSVDDLNHAWFEVRREIPFDPREIDSESAPDLSEKRGERIPLVFVSGRLAFKYLVGETTLRCRCLPELPRASARESPGLH
jgi:hypothetical protein